MHPDTIKNWTNRFLEKGRRSLDPHTVFFMPEADLRAALANMTPRQMGAVWCLRTSCMFPTVRDLPTDCVDPDEMHAAFVVLHLNDRGMRFQIGKYSRPIFREAMAGHGSDREERKVAWAAFEAGLVDGARILADRDTETALLDRTDADRRAAS